MSLVSEELRRRLSLADVLIPPARRDLGNPSWEAAKGRILILRLSSFADIEGSTSHLVLFAECRRALPEAYLDLAFFPDRRDRAAIEDFAGRGPKPGRGAAEGAAAAASYFYGLSSGRSPEDFDLVLLSNSFALELVNLSYLFALTGLPSRASARAAAALTGEKLPIIILGGSNAASAGALLLPGDCAEEASDALVDGIYFGEGEGDGDARGGICDIARAGAASGSSRAERLALLGGVAGLWLALSGKAASRRTLKPYPRALLSYPILNSPGASTAKLQISAGCPGYCSFCLEGWESRPYRELPLEDILRSARELKARTGASTLEIYSYNFNTHARVFELIFELARLFRRVNFMSQRLDILASSPRLVEAELAADKRSFTLGIEGISDRMRAFYRKGIALSDIDAALTLLCRPAVRELKLFYILSGTEGDADFAEFASFALALAERKRLKAPGLRILVSAGYLVRLPFTPLQFAPLRLERGDLEAEAGRIAGACEAAGLEFRLAADFDEYYVDQLLALGGRSLGPWLEGAAARGIAYDGSLSRGAARGLELFAGGAGLLEPGFSAEKPASWRPPLAFSDENHELLYRQYRLAASCAPKEGRLPVPASPGPEAARALERLTAAKRSFASILVRLTFPEEIARAAEEYRASYLQRLLLAAAPEATSFLFDAEEALFGRPSMLEDFARRYCGEACYRLLGPDERRLEAAAAKAGLETIAALPEPETIEVLLELPPAFSREAEEAIKRWLAEERISFIERRQDAARLLECAKADVKKRLFAQARLASSEGAFRASLRLGRKARAEGILSRLGPEARREARLRILGWD